MGELAPMNKPDEGITNMCQSLYRYQIMRMSIGLRRLLPLNNKAIIPLNSLALAHLCAIYTE
uniref:Uncharacterized protein n=1 Tax=Saccharomyces cerevisiae (strain ATCC 204508 / S288c) TaxID=559292 RepID=E9PAE7_YEAST|nr:unknown [Saccharomyces cerevisiae]